jgi:hypothetical protein
MDNLIKVVNPSDEAQAIEARNLFAEHAHYEFAETLAGTLALQLRARIQPLSEDDAPPDWEWKPEGHAFQRRLAGGAS